jgi:hypothetical protein
MTTSELVGRLRDEAGVWMAWTKLRALLLEAADALVRQRERLEQQERDMKCRSEMSARIRQLEGKLRDHGLDHEGPGPAEYIAELESKLAEARAR